MDMSKEQRGLVIGAIIGALLGAGVAYLLMKNPVELEPGAEVDPLSAGELIGLTGAAAVLIRRLDDLRRKL